MTSNAFCPFLGRIFRSVFLFLACRFRFYFLFITGCSTENNLGNSFITSRSRSRLGRWRRKISRCLPSISSKFIPVFFPAKEQCHSFSMQTVKVYLLSLLKYNVSVPWHKWALIIAYEFNSPNYSFGICDMCVFQM